MADDSELLGRYCRDRSEAAFTELVHRHFPMVYLAALRQVGGNTHQAQDVSQAVFTHLARKASLLADRPSVAGWLYHCARFLAARVARSERRRIARHLKTQEMAEFNTEPSALIDWERIGSLIDEALLALNPRDRELVLLRYFHEDSFLQISAKLGVSADAARLRLGRALDKMHTRLAGCGIESTAAALSLALASQAHAAIPVGAAASVAVTALTAPTPMASVALMSQILMSTTKIKIGLLAVTALVVGALVFQIAHQREKIRVLEQDLLVQQSTHQKLIDQHQQLATIHPTDGSGAQLDALLARLASRRAGALSPGSSPSNGPMHGLKQGNKPLRALANAGVATPFAALESSIWARYNGDVDTLAKMITFTPDGRDAATKLWALLPANIQSQFATPEQFAALFLVDGFPSDVAGYMVTGDRQNGPTPNDWLVQIQLQRVDGSSIDGAAALEQVSGHWMLLLGANGIRKLANSLGIGLPP